MNTAARTLFTSGSTEQSKSVFGGSVNSHQSQNAARSVFGGGSSTSQVPGRSLFSSESKQNSSARSLFSAEPKQNPSGKSLFSESKPSSSGTQSLFGKNPPSTARSLFASTSSQRNPSDGGIFGNRTSATSSASAKSVFSSAPQPNHAQSIFGGSNQRSVFGHQSSSELGAPRSLFGRPVTTEAHEPAAHLYGGKDALTPDELAAFMAQTFSFGGIPMKLPPRELCH